MKNEWVGAAAIGLCCLVFSTTACLRQGVECVTNADCPVDRVCASGACAVPADEPRVDSGEADTGRDVEGEQDARVDADIEPDDECLATYGVRCEGLVEGYIKASNTRDRSQFGEAVVADGGTLIVGAPYEGSVNFDTGAVYIFERRGGGWQEVQLLRPSSGDVSDRFGLSIASDGDTLVVGAPGEDGSSAGVGGDRSNNDIEESGAVFVYTRSSDGWKFDAYLKAANPTDNAAFGQSVAIHDGVIVVGAPNEESREGGVGAVPSNYSLTAAGAVYLFSRGQSDEWEQVLFIKAEQPKERDAFGEAVAIDDGVLVVSAPYADDLGEVHVFERDTNTWRARDILLPPSDSTDASFGQAIDVDNGVIAVGSPAYGVDEQDEDLSDLSGIALVYTFEGGEWIERQRILPSNSRPSMLFGNAVSLAGGRLLIGAHGEGSATRFLTSALSEGPESSSSGAAYLFDYIDSTWVETLAMKAPYTEEGDLFGLSVGVGDDYMVVGMPGDDSSHSGIGGERVDNDALESGAVVIYPLP